MFLFHLAGWPWVQILNFSFIFCLMREAVWLIAKFPSSANITLCEFFSFCWKAYICYVSEFDMNFELQFGLLWIVLCLVTRNWDFFIWKSVPLLSLSFGLRWADSELSEWHCDTVQSPIQKFLLSFRYGDYPKLPERSQHERDPWYDWDHQDLRLNWGEPVRELFPI